MQKRIEYVVDKNSKHRLTVAKDRVTIKFAAGSDEKEKDDINSFFLRVAELTADTPLTLRGTILSSHHWLHMASDGKKVRHTFKRDVDGNVAEV